MIARQSTIRQANHTTMYSSFSDNELALSTLTNEINAWRAAKINKSCLRKREAEYILTKLDTAMTLDKYLMSLLETVCKELVRKLILQ